MTTFSPSRRNLVVASAAMVATSLAACATPQASASKTFTFVLVHGAWHGGWCYSRVAKQLRQMGHTVYAVTLTGLGERSHLLSPQIRLQTHIDDVVNLIKWEDLDGIVLVGHSYGGIVVTGAAEQLKDRLNAVVFLDAFIPEAGQSLLDLSSPVARSRMNDLAVQSGGLYIKPFPAKLFDVNEADRAWVDSKCTPQPYATFRESLPVCSAIHAVKSRLFVRSAYFNPQFEATANRLQAAPGWRVARLNCGHDMMIDKPDETTRLLIEAARSDAHS
jgi:pimeloyl-ACP methyl ester carboxylesterase